MAEGEKQGPRNGSGGIIVPSIIVLVLGVGSGAFYELMFGAVPQTVVENQVGASDKKPVTMGGKPTSVTEGATLSKNDVDRLKEHFVPLEPIIVNIGGNAGRWLRIKRYAVFSQQVKDGREALVSQMSEDIMGYLRSISVTQLETATGLEFLKDDLREIVHIRTKGRADRFVLRTLVVE